MATRTKSAWNLSRLASLFLGLIAVEGAAQSAVGRVMQPDGTTPAAGVVVTALDQAGKQVATALSGSSGRYSLRLPQAGRYTIRALRVGFRPSVIGDVLVSADSVVVGDLTLSQGPVMITGVTIRETSDCDLRGSDATAFLDIWEQARTALTAARLAEEGGPIDVQLARIDGQVDAMKYYAPETVGEPEAQMNVRSAREWVANRLFASTPPETLEVSGYIRSRSGNGWLYDAPNPAVFLSDGFVARNCFRIISPPKQHPPEWIGIGFAPRAIRSNVTEVAGVLWFDRRNAELRRIEFEYVNVPEEARQVCEGVGLDDPIRRHCYEHKEDGSNRVGAGGDVDYRRLPSGQWLPIRWTVRTPSDTFNLRPSGRKVLHLRPNERCSSRAVVGAARRLGDCTNVYWPVPRMSVVSTSVARFIQGGVELYRDEASFSVVMAGARGLAGKRPADVVVTAADSAGRPLHGAIVQIEQPGRVGITESDGIALLRVLPPGSTIMSVRCRGYHAARFTLRLQPDSAHRVSIRMLPEAGQRATTKCWEESDPQEAIGIGLLAAPLKALPERNYPVERI